MRRLDLSPPVDRPCPAADRKAAFSWQIEETIKAIAEADRGDFATLTALRKVLKKWGRG
jgi:hypothetical protein